LLTETQQNFDTTYSLSNSLLLIRHTGWIASFLVAVAVYHLTNRRQEKQNGDKAASWCQLASYLVAIDAMLTDLVGFNPVFMSTASTQSFQSSSLHHTFFCGNFGLILLHSSWFDDDKSVIGILEKMIQVTMMRGAQSGGVVTFKGKSGNEDDDGENRIQMKSIRSRVVKSKRADLSKLLSAKLRRDAFSSFNGHCSLSSKHVRILGNDSVRGGDDSRRQSYRNVRFYAGHTRFATSSKANLEGTHPHQWTPPTHRRMYNFYTSGEQNKNRLINRNTDLSGRGNRQVFVIDNPKSISVENYITHNGDFEYYSLNNVSYDIETIQKWLEIATGSKMPAVVDSAAIAGVVDLIRCKGSFALSCRYVLCLGLPTSQIVTVNEWLPNWNHYEKLGLLFEKALHEFQNLYPMKLDLISLDSSYRETLTLKVTEKLVSDQNRSTLQPFTRYISNNEEGVGAYQFAKTVVDAFFDNDLFNTVKIFMQNASGSFGLCVMSSLDAHDQICIAARGQSMSVAVYPQKRMICYGSEQAAVKAGMSFKLPNSSGDEIGQTNLAINDDALRLDLDDVGGEICLIDWSGNTNAVSPPNRHINPHHVMYHKVALYLMQETRSATQPKFLCHRMTKLTNNPLILPLKNDSDDTILQDLDDIPRICRAIQNDWRNANDNAMFCLNRLTAVNLRRCLKERLEGYVSGRISRSRNKVDILLTGCEVSLWLAEQFASDLQKAFPNLHVHATSSNKLLGLFGQEDISIPSIGFPYTDHTLKFDDAIMIIVSHSGGTFAPLACSSLFQSFTKNIFVVTSEWDTQIGKQLRSMYTDENESKLVLNSHIFSTAVGTRTAEPCSISVVATHQLLTNIFQYICIVILNNEKYRQLSGAIVTERDLQVLERCNRDNIDALEEIVGTDDRGTKFESHEEKELRKAGDFWSEHILENAKAYIMSFLYIFGTVIAGYPLVTGLATVLGLEAGSNFSFLTRLFDATIYFFLPQINVILLRIIQGRPLRHRMVGRTVVIADIPWVKNAAEAFLSKIFACSYSIAGLNVHSANPTDHLVHRMTHRVVRGTLIVCGRPDGRLSALTAAENAVSLSINQASSIQSIGSTCETITIGHNRVKLPLSARAIFLKRHRPLFLCEYLLGQKDGEGEMNSSQCGLSSSTHSSHHRFGSRGRSQETLLDETIPRLDNHLRVEKTKKPKIRSSVALLGQYKRMEKETINKLQFDQHFLDQSKKISMRNVIDGAIYEKKWLTEARRLFEFLDKNNDGILSMVEFVEGLQCLKCDRTQEDLAGLFLRSDTEGRGYLTFDGFFQLMSMYKVEVESILQPCIRDSRGLIQVGASKERFFGANLIEKNRSNVNGQEHISISTGAMKSQNFSQELYESRIASLQRFVSMTVMFHQMGSRVQNYFANTSFGLLGYRMDRSHSIMRIATTASPISGAEIRDRAKIIHYMRKVRHSVHIISVAWLEYKKERNNDFELKSCSYGNSK